MGFLGGSVVKNPPAKAGDTGSIPGSGRCPGEGNYLSHSGNLAWEILWTEGPGGLQSMGLQRIGYNSVTKQQWMLPFPRCAGQPHRHQQTVPSASGESQETKPTPQVAGVFGPRSWFLRQLTLAHSGVGIESYQITLPLMTRGGCLPRATKEPSFHRFMYRWSQESNIASKKKKKTTKGQC